MSSSTPHVLFEHEAAQSIERLDAAWQAEPTFALLPERSAVDAAWVRARLEALPAPLRSGCFALLTSGSTGRPKLVIGARARADQLARVLHEAQASEPVAETLVTLPLSYSYAFVNQYRWARCHERALTLSAGLRAPDELAQQLARAEGAMLCLVGSQTALLQAHFAGRRFEGITRLHFAGGRFPQAQLPLLRELFPAAEIFNNFGCAEAMPRLTLRRAEASADASDVGQPLPGVELRTSSTGAVEFRSPYRMLAQVDDAGVTCVDDEAWVATGDLGELLPGGSLRLLGRSGDVFKRHGEKVSLAQLLDSVRAAWPGEAAFYLESDPRSEPGHVLVLSPAPDSDALRGILRQLRDRYTRAQWPLRIESVEAMPLLPNAKVDTQRLSAQLARTVHWHQRI